MIKIKKLLTSLAAIGLVASTSSVVVSCGLSNDELLNRTIDTSVYKTVFNNSISNWNMAATMQSADFKILANTQDTLLTYKNSHSGDRFDIDNLESQIVDKDTIKKDDSSITLKVNDNAQWFKMTTGEFVGKITANDIANTARYTLNTANGSELAKDWITFINGAQKYSDNPSDESKFIVHNDKDKTDDTGIIINKDDNTIKFILANKNSADRFETALATGTFSPTPDIALKMGADYGRNNDYKNVLISGPFYLSKFEDRNIMEFRRNPNYKYPEGKKSGIIKTIKYFYNKNTDDVSKRRFWETGDITEAAISPSDKYGVDNYKNFAGKESLKNNLVGQKYIYFNFAKQDKDGKPDTESNNALSHNSVRTWIAYNLNRKLLAQYFAGSTDENEINKYLANSFNPLGYLGNDYDEELSKDFNNTKLEDSDAYYHNDNLITDADFTKKNLLEKVKTDLGNKKVTLTFLTSGVNTDTFNPYIRWMLKDFNNIKDNPIQIVEQATSDDPQYQKEQEWGDYSMFITGQTPTYIDPMSFLVNIVAGGTMKHYNGTSRLFDTSGTNIKFKDNAKSKFDSSDELLDAYKDFTDKTNEANKESGNQRYTDFASAEADAMYKYKLNIPMYIPNGEEVNYLTYVGTNRPNVGYGYNDYRLDEVTLYKTAKELSKTFNKDTKNKAALIKQD